MNKIYAGHVIKRKRISSKFDQKHNDAIHKASMAEVLKVITENPSITIGQLYITANVTRPTVRKCVKELLEAGKIKERKAGRVKILEAIE